MIHAAIYENKKKECTGFKLSGHAEYAEYGQDVVCAAVSVLVINTINAIECFTDDSFSLSSKEDSGTISCQFKDTPLQETQLLLRTMILGLSNMADDANYAEYIDLTFEEV